MQIEYDPDKNNWNIKKRNLSFEQAKELDWETTLIIEDIRNDYPEQRFLTLPVICFALITGGIRVISFRKANPREVKRYEQATIDK